MKASPAVVSSASVLRLSPASGRADINGSRGDEDGGEEVEGLLLGENLNDDERERPEYEGASDTRMDLHVSIQHFSAFSMQDTLNSVAMALKFQSR